MQLEMVSGLLLPLGIWLIVSPKHPPSFIAGWQRRHLSPLRWQYCFMRPLGSR